MPNCCICGKEVHVWGGKKVMLKGKNYACFDCVKKAGHNPLTWTHNMSTTPEMLKAEIEAVSSKGAPVKQDDIQVMKDTIDRKRSSLGLGARARTSDTFKPDKTFYKKFYLDTVHKKWQAYGPVHTYADLVSFDYEEDGGTIVSGGAGRALVGGALFGGVSAVVGAATGKKKQSDYVNSMKIRLTVNDINHPTEYVDLNPIKQKVKRGSGQYRKMLETAQEIMGCLELILRENQSMQESSSTSPSSDPADEIMKYKKLFDAGAITQDEYDQKKKQLLGL